MKKGEKEQSREVHQANPEEIPQEIDGRGGKITVLHQLEIGSVIYILAAIVLGAIFGNFEILIGILVGGLIAILNFRAWQWFGKKLIQKNSRGKAFIALQMALKSLFPFVLIGIALWVFEINEVGLSLGISAIIGAIVGYTLWATCKILWIKKNKKY